MKKGDSVKYKGVWYVPNLAVLQEKLVPTEVAVLVHFVRETLPKLKAEAERLRKERVKFSRNYAAFRRALPNGPLTAELLGEVEFVKALDKVAKAAAGLSDYVERCMLILTTAGWVTPEDPTPITEIGLATRTANTLCRSGLRTVGVVFRILHKEGADFPERVLQFGPKSFANLLETLTARGYELPVSVESLF